MVLLVYFFETDLELEILVFVEGENQRTLKKTLWARMRTNNKLNPHVTTGPGIEPKPQWCEVSPLTTVSSPLPYPILSILDVSTNPILCGTLQQQWQFTTWIIFLYPEYSESPFSFFTKIIGLNWLHQFIVTIFFRPWGSVCGLVYC